jgi:AcrR family transcriptional regulator
LPVLGKTKQNVVSEFRCSEILEAARGVFARKGFNAATVDDIAQAAGLAKGTVYLYFPSKREIYLETVRQGSLALQDEVRHSMESASDTAGKIRAFIHTRLCYADRNRDFVRIYYTEFSNMLIHPQPVRSEFQDLYTRQADALARVLEEGMARRELRKADSLALARIIYDTSRGLIAQRLLGLSDASVEQDSTILFDLIWKGVGCRKR